MAPRPKTQTEWSQGNRDLLVELKTQSSQLKESITELRDDIKEIRDGTKSDIEFLKADKISRAEAVRIQVDAQTLANDHESRIRKAEKDLADSESNFASFKSSVITWGSAIGIAFTAAQFILGILIPHFWK